MITNGFPKNQGRLSILPYNEIFYKTSPVIYDRTRCNVLLNVNVLSVNLKGNLFLDRIDQFAFTAAYVIE